MYRIDVDKNGNFVCRHIRYLRGIFTFNIIVFTWQKVCNKRPSTKKHQQNWSFSETIFNKLINWLFSINRLIFNKSIINIRSQTFSAFQLYWNESEYCRKFSIISKRGIFCVCRCHLFWCDIFCATKSTIFLWSK